MSNLDLFNALLGVSSLMLSVSALIIAKDRKP